MVIKGLARPQVILGMDLMPEFQVLVDTQLREARPKDDPVLANPATVHQLQKIPPGSVLHVRIPNPWPRDTVLFTPSSTLPSLILGTPAVSTGATLTLPVFNRRDETFLLQPGWTLGELESVHVLQTPTTTPRSPNFPHPHPT